MLKFASTGELSSFIEKLGAWNVRLCMNDKDKTIDLRGFDTDIDLADNHLSSPQIQPPIRLPVVVNVYYICFVEDPERIRTPFGHAYCVGCLES